MRRVWYMAEVEYFDEAGKMVGAAESSDGAGYCGGQFFSAIFGDAPSCPLVPSDILVGADGGDSLGAHVPKNDEAAW